MKRFDAPTSFTTDSLSRIREWEPDFDPSGKSDAYLEAYAGLCEKRPASMKRGATPRRALGSTPPPRTRLELAQDALDRETAELAKGGPPRTDSTVLSEFVDGYLAETRRTPDDEELAKAGPPRLRTTVVTSQRYAADPGDEAAGPPKGAAIRGDSGRLDREILQFNADLAELSKGGPPACASAVSPRWEHERVVKERAADETASVDVWMR